MIVIEYHYTLVPNKRAYSFLTIQFFSTLIGDFSLLAKEMFPPSSFIWACLLSQTLGIRKKISSYCHITWPIQ